MDISKFKHKISFSSVVTPIISEDKDKYLSIASIERLKPFLPKDTNITDNAGFLPFCGNGFVANRTNENGHAVGTLEAIAIAENSKYIFLDIEHSRKNLCGMITSTAYSEFGSDKPLTKEEILKDYLTKPFNIVYAGIIWRAANPDLADYIEDAGDPESNAFGTVSLSWEVAYNDSKLMLLSNGSKNLEDGKIIEEGEEATKLEKLLKSFGGSGYTEDGDRVISVLINEILPLGFGLVEMPAADVKGLLTKVSQKSSASIEKSTILEKNQSQSNTSDVKNTDNNKILEKIQEPMKLNSIKDLTDENLKEAKASDLTALFESEIKKISDNYVQKTNEDKDAIKASQENYKDLEAKFTELQKNAETVQNQLNELVKSSIAREQEEVFTARMSSFDEAYELSNEDREIIGDMIKDLDAEKYQATAKKLETLLAAKKKVTKKVKDSEKEEKTEKVDDKGEEKKESKASIENKDADKTVVSDVIDKGEKKESVIAATTTVTESLQDKMNKAFNISNWSASTPRNRK